MATYKHLRSSTANKRPTTSIADGQLAINTNTASPGLFFKDSAGTGIVKVGPVHVGTTAPNATPAAGGSSGNYLGEQWLDTSVSPSQMKVWNGSAWVGIVADELPVSKLQDGDARQLLQTDAAGTGVEWTSNVDVPGTLDVTSTATFDSIARHPLGSAAAPTLTFTGDTNTGIYSPGADQVAVATNGTGRLFVDANGRVGVGATSTGLGSLEVAGPTGDNVIATFRSGDATAANNAGGGFRSISSATAASRVAQVWLDADGADFSGGDYFIIQKNGNSGTVEFNQFASAAMTFKTGDIERARIDSSGRLLVGTSSSSSTSAFVIQGYAGVSAGAGEISITRGGTPSAADQGLGTIRFQNNNGNTGAQIDAFSEGSWTAGSNHRSRLTFSTTADGASSPTERMRITSGGDFLFGKTTNVASDNGAIIGELGQSFSVASQGFQGNGFHRNGNDGGIIGFFQDGTQEGSISVSGGTVSYNGAHLSRWSQLASGAERIEILRGSVLSNLDEMCEWGEEENEQLNRMKVSDIEGDKNVSGVFQAWDDDDDTYTNDFYCAMTGDFIIRIAEGVTVERGDLLMSAGDGTAKPQDDDIIRSKTIAKVTSTNVSCTYDDGSYCVPCVLMAC